MTWKYLVEFHDVTDPNFVAMYHYNDLDDFLNDCLYGDLQFLSHLDKIEFLVSRLDHEKKSFWSFEEDTDKFL